MLSTTSPPTPTLRSRFSQVRVVLVLLGSFLTLAASGLLGATHASAESPTEPNPNHCVENRPEARYGAIGYNHLVHLTSRCKKPVSCEVTTNVNPVPVSATLNPGEKTTVITYRGSPASSFQATVSCEYSAHGD